jgi:hypothetical protein
MQTMTAIMVTTSDTIFVTGWRRFAYMPTQIYMPAQIYNPSKPVIANPQGEAIQRHPNLFYFFIGHSQ